jgi:hypothetical protein
MPGRRARQRRGAAAPGALSSPRSRSEANAPDPSCRRPYERLLAGSQRKATSANAAAAAPQASITTRCPLLTVRVPDTGLSNDSSLSANGRRVKSGCRLVEKDQIRVTHQRQRKVKPPALAARERLHARPRLVLQAHLVRNSAQRSDPLGNSWRRRRGRLRMTAGTSWNILVTYDRSGDRSDRCRSPCARAARHVDQDRALVRARRRLPPGTAARLEGTRAGPDDEAGDGAPS